MITCIKSSGMRLLLTCAITCTLLSGCSHLRFPAVFKIDVAQGNILDPEKVSQLRPGMNRRQVVYLLGNPLLRTPLTPNEWRYLYQFSKSSGVPKQYEIRLEFDGDVLKAIHGDINSIKTWHKINS